MSFRQVLIAVDQLANTLTGGMADETLSARVYRIELNGGNYWPRRFIDGLFFWQENHCARSWQAEYARHHLPASYRK